MAAPSVTQVTTLPVGSPSIDKRPPLTLLCVAGECHPSRVGARSGRRRAVDFEQGAPRPRARLDAAEPSLTASAPRQAQVPSSAYGSVPNGYGVYTWPDGSRYEGDWLNGVKNGRGKYYWPRYALPQPSADTTH